MTRHDDKTASRWKSSAEKFAPENLGWRRKPELDERHRQAWEMRDGAVLLLDPSGLSDSLLRRKAAK